MNIELIPLKSPVDTGIKIPGSKSYTNRALILAALTPGVVEIINPLFSDDTNAMINCLRTLGVKIDAQPKKIIVSGDISKIKNGEYLLDANLSATTIRFCLALSTVIPGVKILTGKPGLLQRPIKDLVDALRELGAKIKYLKRDGFPPLKIESSGLRTKKLLLDGKISSQFLSALLMIAPKIGGIEIDVRNLNSTPYVHMTEEIMKQFGINVINKDDRNLTVLPDQNYSASKIEIEGDFSSATYFGAVAALTKSNIILENLNENSIQADAKFFDILEKMGNKISKGNNQIIVEGNGPFPINVNMADCPDSIQTLSVLAAFAKGKTKITGIETLRFKETDRINALRSQLKKMGIKTEVKGNSLIIYGGNPKSAVIETFEDHRMAMSFAVAGAKLIGMIIENSKVVEKTFPLFWENLKKIGVGIKKIKPSNVILVGFMGTGKSSIAPLLARKLKKEIIEMDDFVKKISKRESVEEIFKKDGEEKFREFEFKVSKNLSDKKDLIVSTGGGVIMNDLLMKNLKNDGLIVFLDTSLETIRKRLIDVSNRPLWKDQKKIEEIYNVRLPKYKNYADVTVKTDGRSLGQVSDEIINKIENL